MSDTILAIDLGRHKRVYDCRRAHPTSPARGDAAQARGVALRVLTVGGRQRNALDVVLVNRLPGVELLAAGGPGIPALAARFAKEWGLVLTTVPVRDGSAGFGSTITAKPPEPALIAQPVTPHRHRPLGETDPHAPTLPKANSSYQKHDSQDHI